MFSPPNKRVSAFGGFGAALSKPSVVSQVKTHSGALVQSIAHLFNHEKYSDATICIHDVKLPVHKLIIYVQSEYFKKAFQEGFIKGDSGTITFRENSGAAYWRVFEYLYTGDYLDDLSTDKFKDDPKLLKDSRVYVLADMFLLKDLKELSTIKLQEKLKESWTSDSFPDCIREIYASTSSRSCGLRLAVVQAAIAHAHELGEKEIFKDLLREGGDFAIEYVDGLTR